MNYKIQSPSKIPVRESKNYKRAQSERELGHFASAKTGSCMLRPLKLRYLPTFYKTHITAYLLLKSIWIFNFDEQTHASGGVNIKLLPFNCIFQH